mgnify:CR=1 FL=1
MMKSLLVAALALQATRRWRRNSIQAAPGSIWRQLVAIGPRPSGSPAIEQTRKYIKDQLASTGLTAVEQSWDDQTRSTRSTSST